jgi:predicted pyridoxine 5'-phosphate oxidase superfamily flavin-nucleotide-binding protein
MAEITSEIKKLIESNALALATVDSSGNPHCIAVGDVKVVSKNQILVGDNYMAETVRNIKANKNVSLVSWCRQLKKDCVGYELRGTAKYFKEGKWLKKVKVIHKGFPAKGAILVTVSKIKRLA